MPSPDNAGTHILDIMSALNKRKNNTPLIEVKKTLTILLEQGNLYTGADDDRYCAIE